MDDKPAKIRERRSSRFRTNRFLTWRTCDDSHPRVAGLIEQSMNGMAMVTSVPDAPSLGAIIMPSSEAMFERYGFQKARVRDTTFVPDGTAITYAAILS